MTDLYLQTVLALGAVIGLILVMAFFLRKRGVKGGMMQVLAYHSFGPRKGLAAIKVGREVLLLGVTTTDLKLLKTLSEADLLPELQGDLAEKVERLRNLREKLDEPL
jgi:flagellar biogenesis protein FliO